LGGVAWWSVREWLFRRASVQGFAGHAGFREGGWLTDSPEATVRHFLASWGEPDSTELASFLSDDAVWVDGPQGVRRGAVAIVEELTKQLATSRGQPPEIATLVADDGTVMVEWHGGWTMGEKWISTSVMAVFEVADGRINEMRETYDLQSVLDQMKSASDCADR
jgi:limonene-1,2-epoxide hydrolase